MTSAILRNVCKSNYLRNSTRNHFKIV